ncbi:unnamed protein product [Calypogeia fissa]
MARHMRRPLAMDFLVLSSRKRAGHQLQMRTMMAADRSNAAETSSSSSRTTATTSTKDEVSAGRQLSGSSIKGTLGKRFYKNALVKPVFVSDRQLQQQQQEKHGEEGEKIEVSLDHRVLRTPAKKPLRFSNPALAHAIAAEWEWQDSSGVRSYTMPLMKLASISIDQVPKDRERIIVTLLKYCHTDALCCRASPDSVLYDKQAKHWDPLLEWVEAEIGARPVVSSSIFGPSQPEDVVRGLEKCLRGLNDWELAAIDSLAGSARSIVVALAIARNKLTIEEAIEVIRVEENHQVDDWGYVEGGHDIDEADIRVRIAAASVFLRLL